MSRKKRPDPAELEAQADQILHQDILKAIHEGFEALKLPSNDPEYLRNLQASDAARNAIANKLTQVDLVPDGNRTYLGVGSFQHHEAREVAQLLASHFELKIRQHE
jgi:hypothetical protein